MTEHYRGSCHCGAVRFEFEAEVFDGRGLPTIND